MIKQFSLVIIAALMLSACGGSDDDFCCDGKPLKSSEASVSSDESSSSSAAAAPSMSFGFVEGIDGWYINGSDPGTIVTVNMELAHDITNAAMEIKPLDWTQHASSNWLYQAKLAFEDAPLDLSDSTLSITTSIPQSYIDDGALIFQLIVHHTDEANNEYGSYINVSDLTANADGDYILERAINVDSAVSIGIQIAVTPTDLTIKDTILVKSVLITLPADSSGGSSSSAPSNQQEIPVTSIDGWSSDNAPTTLSIDNGVVVTADWSATENIAMFVLDEAVDMTGATVTYVIDVPAAYVDEGSMVIQPYIQQNSGDYQGVFDSAIPGGWNTASGLTAGENTIVHGPFTAPPVDIQHVGIKFQKPTTAVTGDITIRSVTITFP